MSGTEGKGWEEKKNFGKKQWWGWEQGTMLSDFTQGFPQRLPLRGHSPKSVLYLFSWLTLEWELQYAHNLDSYCLKVFPLRRRQDQNAMWSIDIKMLLSRQVNGSDRSHEL